MNELTINVFLDYFVTIFKVLLLTLKSIFKTFFADEKSVENEIVLITGAGNGIGEELAIKYADLGAVVVCWDINEENNQETVELIRSKGQKAFGFTVDVSNRERVFEVASKVLSEVGDVTILVQNAGTVVIRETLQHSEKDVKKLFDVNVLSLFWVNQAFLPRMIENNRGHIVATCSVGGIIPTRNIVPYCASKFAVRGMMEGISNELYMISNGKSNIKFTTVYPFYVNTTLFNSEQMNIRFKSLTPLLTAKEVANAIIEAQRKEFTEVTVPCHWLYIDRILRFFPRECYAILIKFTNAYIQTEVK